MIVTGALTFWNELPEDLDRCIRGLANVADRVVALDGAYSRYPGATPTSPPDQIAAIRDAARDVGMDCEIVQPTRLWSGQCEKRTHLLQLAAIDCKWFVTVDADHVITADRDFIRQNLRKEFNDVIEVPYVTPINPDRSLDESAVAGWHVEQVTKREFIPHIWKSLSGYRVERLHWYYSAVKNGHRVWMWGGDGTYPSVGHSRMRKGYEVEHRTLFRTPEQIRASRAFLNDRAVIVEQTGQEDDLPTLPRPKFDYRTIPE